MKTFKFWLEPDENIPQFKKLYWETIDVSFTDVITKGIHPWQGSDKHHSLGDRFVKILNSEDFKPTELVQFNYCNDISSSIRSYYHVRKSRFEEILKRIDSSVYFVDKLSYVELLSIAKQRLKSTWSHQVAYSILSKVCGGFDAIRRFIKTKDKTVKLSGYSDIQAYDLGKILSLDDFSGEDSIIITEVIGSYSFRSSEFLVKVTDSEGKLKLTDSIQHFQLTAYGDSDLGFGSVVYNCHKTEGLIRFIPEINAQPTVKALAKAFARKWQSGNGKYCFSLDIAKVESMVLEKCSIDFGSVQSMEKSKGKSSFGKLTYSTIKGYTIGKIPSLHSSNETVKEFLRNHGISMTGRKEELLDKLATLSVEVYKEHESVLNSYFKNQKFIKVESLSKGSSIEVVSI